MGYQAKVIADSRAPSGARLTTLELTYPRLVHSELMTHRVFSRNAASSRAIPIKKIIEMVRTDPAMPVYWGMNQAGMQAAQELDEYGRICAKKRWLAASRSAIYHAQKLVELNVHKQIVNRILEPWAWITVVITATEWANFFGLRCDRMAQPEIRRIALLALGAMMHSEPRPLSLGAWHLPYVNPDEEQLPTSEKLAISVARCGRVSYVRQGEVRDSLEDVQWHDRALASRPRHLSPFEHQARADGSHLWNQWSGNFYGGFTQYRKTIKDEAKAALTLEEVWSMCAEEVDELMRAA